MPSTYTDLGFELQAAGEGLNVWGTKLNTNVFQRVNYAIAGYLSIAITGDYTLSSSNSSSTRTDFEGRHGLLKFTGTLSANATITVPSTAMRFLIWNATNKVLTFTTGAGNTVTIDAGDKTVVWCDGAACHTITFGTYDLKTYITSISASAGAVPGVTGHAGKYLYTDGSTAYWKQPQATELGDYETSIKGFAVAMATSVG